MVEHKPGGRVHNRILVTGHSGFVGGWLLDNDPRCLGLTANGEDIDINDRAAIDEVIVRDQPDAVIHLAAQSNVPQSMQDPEETYRINVQGTQTLLAALVANGFAGTLLFVSSGDVYGRVSEDALPITEKHPTAPRNHYAASKVAGEAICTAYSNMFALDVVIARPFNHTGPRQADTFAIPSFAKQIAERNHQSGLELLVGDLGVTRDFLDVRDVISAYFQLLKWGHPGDIYNVSSGREYQIADLLDRLIKFSEADVTIQRDPARLRPTEQRRVCGSNRKLISHTGWRPETDINDTLRDLLMDWHRKTHE